MTLEFVTRYGPGGVAAPPRQIRRTRPTAGRLALLGLGLVVGSLWPLALFVIVTRSSLAGWGGGFVASAGWLLVALLTAQLVQRRRARRPIPPVAGSRELAELGDAMAVAAGGGRSDWVEVELLVEPHRRLLVVHRRDGATVGLEPWTAQLVGRADQFDEAVQRNRHPRQRVEVHAQADGVVRATVS